jgi:predicted nucleic acid-binding protein
MLSIGREIAVTSYQLRAKYPALKTLDSLQLAAAIESGCDHFFTNDYGLKRVKEINIIIVDEV